MRAQNTPEDIVKALLAYWNSDDTSTIREAFSREGVDEHFADLFEMVLDKLDGFDDVEAWINEIVKPDKLCRDLVTPEFYYFIGTENKV